MQRELREQVKIFKIKSEKNYKQIAEELKMNIYSFYNWLNGAYELSEEKEKALKGIIKQEERRTEWLMQTKRL